MTVPLGLPVLSELFYTAGQVESFCISEDTQGYKYHPHYTEVSEKEEWIYLHQEEVMGQVAWEH